MRASIWKCSQSKPGKKLLAGLSLSGRLFETDKGPEIPLASKAVKVASLLRSAFALGLASDESCFSGGCTPGVPSRALGIPAVAQAVKALLPTAPPLLPWAAPGLTWFLDQAEPIFSLTDA